jgi:hypothetical protein
VDLRAIPGGRILVNCHTTALLPSKRPDFYSHKDCLQPRWRILHVAVDRFDFHDNETHMGTLVIDRPMPHSVQVCEYATTRNSQLIHVARGKFDGKVFILMQP